MRKIITQLLLLIVVFAQPLFAPKYQHRLGRNGKP